MAAETSEQTLLPSEKEYHALFDNMINGFAYHKVVFDDHGKPLDYIFLDINPAFERLTGLKKENVIGKRATDLLPGIEDEPAKWIETYGRVALTGKPIRFESYSDILKRWYSVSAYSPEKGYFASIFEDTTERRQKDERLRQSEAKFRLLSDTASRLLAADQPQEIVNELCRNVMAHLNCHAFFNYLVDKGKQRLHLNAYAGIPAETAKEIEWLDYGVAVCGCAARDACQIVAEDIPNTPDIRTDLVKSLGIKAYACHPLISAGRVIGTLSFGTRTRTTFTDEDLSLMKTVAGQVAVAMEGKRLLEAVSLSRDELAAKVKERTGELSRTNELLEKVFASIDTHLAYMDRHLNFIRVNRAYAEADERQPAFYVGKNHFALFPNEENQRIFEKVVTTGEPYYVYAKPFEYAEHPERGVTYWDWSLQPVNELDGSVGGVVS